jgi:SAM-dependent methyltransferase
MNKPTNSPISGTAPEQTAEATSGIQPADLKKVYDGIYGDLDGGEDACRVSTGNLDKARTRVRQVLKGLGIYSACNKMQVLDIGCGLGFTSEAFRELGLNVTAIDLSPVAVDRAKAKFPGIDFRCAAFPDDLTENHKFDIIWAVDLPIVGVFESYTTQADFLQPCLKLLKADGRLIVGWHTNFSGQRINGWMNWSFRTIREMRRTFRASPPLIPQIRSFWLSACVCQMCKFTRHSAPIFFLVRAADWQLTEQKP